MEQLSPQLIEKLRTIKLSDGEKKHGRNMLLSLTHKHPIQEKHGFFSTLTFYKYTSAGVFAVLALLLGATSFIAENAVPGDVTYSIKIQVNEQVIGAFAITEEGELEWDVAQAERRMEEAKTLAIENGF